MSDRASDVQDIIDRYKRTIEAGISPVPLANLVDAPHLADIIHDHVDLFDAVTRDYLAALRRHRELPRYLREKIARARVYPEVDETLVKSAFSDLGIPYLDGVDMISVGDSIYTYGPLQCDADGTVASVSTAALLAHELIHAIQADAHGGEAGFAAAYTAAGNYLANAFEIAAYCFGGSPPAAIAAKMPVERPVLKETALYGEWWRLA
ncbi:MAG: hypothetical protein PF508_05275 [Spirochaeta sp.]|nr:hypothetical protein [Spirochaeta sp.]